MERIVLLRSCHSISSGPSVLATADDELHVTISVTNGDNVTSTFQKDCDSSEPIAEDLLGVNKTPGGSTLVHTVKVPLGEFNGRVIIEDVASSALFSPSSEVSIFCVLHSQGVASSSPLFSAYTKVSSFQPTAHADVQLIQHVGLRVVQESIGVCMALVKAPMSNDRSIEGALATEHLRCYHDHIVNWQLERALHTKNAAVDELIQSDILLSDEIKRQREAIGAHLPLKGSDDELTILRSKVKELELERVKELEAMRRLIAERRAEREAHIEARLKESKPVIHSARSTHTTAGQRPSISSTAGGRTTPLRNATPTRGSTPQRSGGGSLNASRQGTSTPLRSSQGRSATPTGGPSASLSTRTPQRSSTPTRSSPAPSVAGTAGRRPSIGTPSSVKSPAGPRATTASTTPSQQAAMLKRAEDNLQRLRGSATPNASSRPVVGRQSPSVNVRNASPLPSRGVPPPPPDIRSSPMRNVPSSATQTSTTTPSAASRRIMSETPPRSSTPTKKPSPVLIKTNTQSIIRMARQ